MRAMDDDALSRILRDDRAGIVTSYGPTDVEAARRAFDLIARNGGKDVVGDSPDLADRTFWNGFSRRCFACRRVAARRQGA